MGATTDEKQQLVSSSPCTLSLVPQSYPWLVISDGKNMERQTFFSISRDRYYTKIIPDLRNKYICCCYEAWLVLVDYDSDECSLLNVDTMEKVKLPQLDMSFFKNCILTSHPNDPNCRVLFINGMTQEFSSCQPGDDGFVKQELVLQGGEFLMSATIFEGNMYGLTFPTFSLVIADLNDPALVFRQLFTGESVRQSISLGECTWFLIESCGELIFVSMHSLHRDGGNFTVFQADFSKRRWVNLKSIGDRVIFLDADLFQGMSCLAAKHGIKGNCIYHTQLRNRSLYVFDLEDQSVTMSLPCPIVSSARLMLQWVKVPHPANRS